MKFLMILLTVLALSSCAHHSKVCKSDCKGKDKAQCELKKKQCKKTKCKKDQCKAKKTHKASECTKGQCQLHKKEKSN